MSRLFICFHFVSFLLLQLREPFAGALEIIDGKNQLTCGQGLTDCRVKDVALPGRKDPVNVKQLELRGFLCCNNNKDCCPCLRVEVNFTIRGGGLGSALGRPPSPTDENENQEMSGDHSEEDDGSEQTEEGLGSALGTPRSPTEYSVRVCYSDPGFMDHCKEVTFTLSHSVLGDQRSLQMWLLLLLKPGTYGSPVNVHASSVTGTITFPTLKEVCSFTDLKRLVKDCDVPRLQVAIDEKRDVALLQLGSSNQTDVALLQLDNSKQTVVICMFMYMPPLKFWTKEPDKCQEWHADQGQMTIPLRSVTPCLCFKVWWKGKKLQRENCPFMNNKELFKRMWHDNVSVSVEEVQTNVEHGSLLTWEVVTPCWLEGVLAVWLCQKASAKGRCEEVNGSRQGMFNHTHVRWTFTNNGIGIMPTAQMGEFVQMNPHPALCVQMEILGMDAKLDPICPFAKPKNGWSLVVLIGILFICVAILGAYAVHSTLKGYIWRWLKDEDIRGAVGGGHIVLLYPPDRDQALPGLVCRLATSLSTMGFSVSLDLWSHAELSVLGPVPWLHSRLDRLQRQGGKVVLVLTQAAWEKAEEWGGRGWERDTIQRRGCVEDGESERGCRSTYSDVFSASLSCILADYLQGRAGERFTLVQFESLPPQPPGGSRPLPELFRGLQLFSLPSQSLAFLTELAFGRGRSAVAGLRKRAGGLRAASRALAGGLREFAGSSAVLRLAGLPQDCVESRVEDPWESVPLQHCVSAPSSPDTCRMASGMDQV